MKALIWIVSLFAVNLIFAILSPRFRFMGNYYRVGGLVTEIIGIIIAKKLCDVYEKQRLMRKARQAGLTPFEYIKKDVSPMLMERLEKHREHPDSIKPDIKGYVKRKELSAGQASILYDEFLQ